MLKLKLNNPSSLDKLTNAFPFQKEAIDFVRDLSYSAIFFEQGLGKTKIAIDLIIEWLIGGEIDSAIVVTKKGLVNNWQEEFQNHSNLAPRVISNDRAANHRAYFSPCRVYLTNYESISIEKERLKLFAKQRRLAIILDESQKIKNPTSKLTKSFFELSDIFVKKVIMTGTPIANRAFDIWSQVYFLDGGKSLGTNFDEFKNDLDIPSGEIDSYISELSDLFPKISNFTIRQTKENSGLELPGKRYKTVYSSWEPLQREMYDNVKNDLRILITKDGEKIIDETDLLLKRLLRLVQITSNPQTIDESYKNIPGKIKELNIIIEDAINKKEKIIIWTSFVDNCRYLKNIYDKYGSVQVNGRMAIQDRNNSIYKFKNNDDTKILVATPAAAKEGLTLTIANNVVFYDRSFSLDDYSQAQDRIHRISQTKICNIYNIIMPDSIDEWVSSLLNIKSASARFGMGDTNMDELFEALQVDINTILETVLGGN